MVCRVCSGQLKDIASFGDQYLSEFNDGKKPDKYPLDLMMCSNCTLVQLKKSVPPDKLYTENYGYRSGINNTIRADLKDNMEKALKKVEIGPGDTILSIGENDGTLLSFAPKNILKVAVEPIKKLAEECQKYADIVVNDFWSYEAVVSSIVVKPMIIFIISCFYDLEDPNKFVKDLTKALNPDGLIVIQQNYLGSMLSQNAFDNIVHEHIEYYSLKALEYLLNRHGLEVVDVELNNINGGSFRTYIKFKGNVTLFREMEEKARLDNWGTYLLFNLRVQTIKNKVVSFIKQLNEEGKTVYAYGASTRGNSLLQYFGLDNTLIKAAVERNPEKWGKKIASLDIPIISEEQARKDKPYAMLVLPWFFKKEIIEREAEYLSNGGYLIFALPELEII